MKVIDVKPENYKTIVIFGIGSFVGSNLAEFFKKDYQVIGTYHKVRPNIPGVLTLPCDVLSKDEIQLILYTFKPHIAIYAVGLSNIEDCAERPDLADALNTVGLMNVAEYCQRYRSQICYISSNFVFGGEKKDYVEMDIPDSNTTYGKTVAASEFYIQKTSLNYTIFRCCKLYGRGVDPLNLTWFEKMQGMFFSGQNITLDNSIHVGCLDVQYLAMLMKLSFEKEVVNRLFQISTTDTASLYEFGKIYASVFLENESLLSKGKFNFSKIATMSSNLQLGDDLFFKTDGTNIEGYLNVKLPSIEESIKFSFFRFNGEKKNFKKGKGISFI